MCTLMAILPTTLTQAMLDQRDFTGKAALHHAVADMEERHQVLQTLLAAKAQVNATPKLGEKAKHDGSASDG